MSRVCGTSEAGFGIPIATDQSSGLELGGVSNRLFGEAARAITLFRRLDCRVRRMKGTESNFVQPRPHGTDPVVFFGCLEASVTREDQSVTRITRTSSIVRNSMRSGARGRAANSCPTMDGRKGEEFQIFLANKRHKTPKHGKFLAYIPSLPSRTPGNLAQIMMESQHGQDR